MFVQENDYGALKRKLISTLMCVGALTAGLFVSGCGSDKAADKVSSAVSSVTDSKSDEKLNKAFDELIKTTNEFNGNNVTWGQQHAENLAKLKAGLMSMQLIHSLDLRTYKMG